MINPKHNYDIIKGTNGAYCINCGLYRNKIGNFKGIDKYKFITSRGEVHFIEPNCVKLKSNAEEESSNMSDN